MPPEERFVFRFAAEPPQEMLPSGRWAETLQAEFLAACLRLQDDPDEDGEVSSARSATLVYHPDRTWAGRTYIPSPRARPPGSTSSATSPSSRRPGRRRPDRPRAQRLLATADFTDETAEANPEWRLDLCDEVIGGWRGEHGRVAAMTLVWGTALTGGGADRHRRARRASPSTSARSSTTASR